MTEFMELISVHSDTHFSLTNRSLPIAAEARSRAVERQSAAPHQEEDVSCSLPNPASSAES